MSKDNMLLKILETERGHFFVEGIDIDKKEVKLRLRKIIMTDELESIIMSVRDYNKICKA